MCVGYGKSCTTRRAGGQRRPFADAVGPFSTGIDTLIKVHRITTIITDTATLRPATGGGTKGLVIALSITVGIML